MMKRLREVGELTVPQQGVVIFLLCALVAYVALRSYRSGGTEKTETATQLPAADQPSPSPGIRP